MLSVTRWTVGRIRFPSSSSIMCKKLFSTHVSPLLPLPQWLLMTMECPPTRWSESLLDNTLISKVGVVVNILYLLHTYIKVCVYTAYPFFELNYFMWQYCSGEIFRNGCIGGHGIDMVAQNLLRMGIKPGDRIGRLTCTASCLDPHHSSCVMSCHVMSCHVMQLFHSCWN